VGVWGVGLLYYSFKSQFMLKLHLKKNKILSTHSGSEKCHPNRPGPI